MLMKYIFLVVFGLLILSACDDDYESKPRLISQVKTYSEEDKLWRTESYEYDEHGKLVRENRNGKIGKFIYEGDRLERMESSLETVDFAYDVDGRLTSISGKKLHFDLVYEGGRVKATGNGFVFNYDENFNITSINNTNSLPYYTADGTYEYDDTNYMYSSFPIPWRLYIGLCRSEFLTGTTDVFRFNTGNNNIIASRLDESQYSVFKYQHNRDRFPTTLTIETHSKDSWGNDYVRTRRYEFEYVP
jgi:YD repeat-containing protein